MDRRSQQNHIRAARDWLGRAEDSLAQENDVQGDLKLMLARAELAHVGQSPRSRTLFLWGRRGAALLLALALAGGVLWKGVPPFMPVEENRQVLNQTGASVSPAPPAEDVPAAAEPPAQPAAPEPPSVRSEPEKQAEKPAVSESPRRAVADTESLPVPKAAPQPPDMEKQQLMQSAGKILRQ